MKICRYPFPHRSDETQTELSHCICALPNLSPTTANLRVLSPQQTNKTPNAKTTKVHKQEKQNKTTTHHYSLFIEDNKKEDGHQENTVGIPGQNH